MKNRSGRSHQNEIESSSQYEEEVHDKLNDLWSEMKHRKNQIIRSVVPTYSRKGEFDEHSRINISSRPDEKSEHYRREEEYEERIQVAEKEILKLRSRLAVEVSNNKLKDVEIDDLKLKINDLLKERKNHAIEKQKESRRLDSTKINIIEHQRLDRDKQKQNKNYQSNIINESSIVENSMVDIEKSYTDGLKGDTERLLQLLRSTEQYKEFVFYYNNNELSFLRNLGRMRRKNCACNLSEREKTLWAPKDVLEIMKTLNNKDQMGLDDEMIERIVYNLNLLYLQRQKVKLEDLRGVYEKKIKIIQRKADANIPYDIVQIQRQKERQLLKTRARSKSTVKK